MIEKVNGFTCDECFFYYETSDGKECPYCKKPICLDCVGQHVMDCIRTDQLEDIKESETYYKCLTCACVFKTEDAAEACCS